MAETKSFSKADEVREFPKGKIEVVTVNGQTVGRGFFEPGWRWSECVKPIVGTESCQVEHFGYVESGRMKIQFDDGSEVEVGPGEMMHAQPGHDGWTVGDEACVIVDLMGAPTYAKG